ncbi:hypothetical protein COO03_04895 [Bacillus sp. AFS098217]|uniref:hypothetical protein n=1 Tax=Bacillus sp. AFS098217 TaxID=2033868 RepID=UPI000BEC9869|nr:hypothetical protein [Bacillus sp. AFS098217]PEB54580.1 hypothetical protein COO03_04895 [Bacillus sp. AFS098217]
MVNTKNICKLFSLVTIGTTLVSCSSPVAEQRTTKGSAINVLEAQLNEKEIGKIKITEKQRNVEPRIEILESHKVDDGGGTGVFREKNSALKEVMILRDKQKNCTYLYTYSSDSNNSGSATITPIECEKQ